MTDQPELHDLTKFLLSRLESYPEEFLCGPAGLESHKWATSLVAIKYCGTAEDRAAIDKAYMDFTLQNALTVLLVPKEEEESKTVGQSPVRVPNTTSLTPNHYGNLSAQAAMQSQQAMMQAQQFGAPMQSLTQQLAQQTVKNLVSQAKDQQKPTVTIPPSLAKAAGLKPMTAKEQIEHWKKRLGL